MNKQIVTKVHIRSTSIFSLDFAFFTLVLMPNDRNSRNRVGPCHKQSDSQSKSTLDDQ